MNEVLGLVTGLVALVGLYFIFQQRRNERRKARLEAYPQRVEVFRCTEEFLGRAWTGNYDDMQVLLQRFFHCKREAQFLFDKSLAAYLDSLYEGVEDHFLLEARLQIEGDDLDFEARANLQHRCFASRHWLGEQNMHLKKHFAKYLDLSAIK